MNRLICKLVEETWHSWELLRFSTKKKGFSDFGKEHKLLPVDVFLHMLLISHAMNCLKNTSTIIIKNTNLYRQQLSEHWLHSYMTSLLHLVTVIIQFFHPQHSDKAKNAIMFSFDYKLMHKADREGRRNFRII